MADDLGKRGPPDRSKVNVHEAWEVAYWTREFGVTEAQLRAAVKAVGTSTVAVRKYLGKRDYRGSRDAACSALIAS
jgi:hypothetical protein